MSKNVAEYIDKGISPQAIYRWDDKNQDAF